MLTEIRKLTAIRAVGLPPGLFADVAPNVMSGWRARAAVESPSHLRRRLPELAAVGGHLAGRAAGRAGTGGHRQPGRPADRHRAPDRRAGRAEGDRRAGQRVPAGYRQGEHPVRHRRGLAGPPRGRGPRRGVPGGARRRADAARAGARVQDQGAGVPAHRADHAEGLLHESLPQGPDRPAGRAGVPVDQYRAPAGHRGAEADRPVRPGREPDLLPGRRDRPGPPRDHRGVGGPGVPAGQARPPPGGPHGLRGRHLPGAARPAALQGDLGRRRRAVARPGRGPAQGLRVPPRRALRQPPQAAGPGRVLRRPAPGDDRGAGRAGRRAARPGLGRHHRAPGRGDQADAAGGRPRAA